MSEELERSSSQLRLDGYDAPYFMAYTVKHRDQVEISGKLGAIFRDDDTPSRAARVEVRVGSYTFDSSEDIEQDWLEEGVYEPSSALPVDGDPAALRHTLWLLSDLRYKQALSSYLKLKGQRVFKAERANKRPSFTKAPRVGHLDPVAQLDVDRSRWRKLVREVGKILASDPAIFDSDVHASFSVETRWLVTSEGTRLRTVQPMYGFHAAGYTRAADGMMLDHSFDLYAPSEGELPSDAQVLDRARALVGTLAKLRQAPILEPFTGPAILSPTATGVFFHEVLGHRLEGHRQDDDSDGQTFSKHLGQTILPTFLSLYDDPTLNHRMSVPLNGSYAYDDEGVPASRVTLVEKGVLKNFLETRRPTSSFPASNGHGRAERIRRPVARMGNLIVEAHQTVTRAELRKQLLGLIRAQKKPFGLIIDDLAGGSTNTSSYGYQAFKGQARIVYRVDAATGEETLVRGVDIVGTPLTTIGKIVAAADDEGVFNGYCGAESGMVPVSAVAPAVLFEEMELQRSAKPRSTGTVLRPPVRSQPRTDNPIPGTVPR